MRKRRHGGSGITGNRSISCTIARNERERAPITIDARDAVAYLVAAATASAIEGESLDIAGPEVLSYGAMIERIAALLLRPRVATPLPSAFGALGAAFAARVSGTPSELLGPLMASLGGDLLADDSRAREQLRVRLHGFDAAVEHALREWEALDPGRAR